MGVAKGTFTNEISTSLFSWKIWTWCLSIAPESFIAHFFLKEIKLILFFIVA
jgi:hypothetical protein